MFHFLSTAAILLLVLLATPRATDAQTAGFISAFRHAESQGNAAAEGGWKGNFFKKLGRVIGHGMRAPDGTITDRGKAQIRTSVQRMPQDEKNRWCGNRRASNGLYEAGGSAATTKIAMSPLRRTIGTAAMTIIFACKSPRPDGTTHKHRLHFPTIEVWPEIREKHKSLSEAANAGFVGSRSYIKKIVKRYANPTTGRFRRGNTEGQNIDDRDAARLILAMERAYDAVINPNQRKRYKADTALPSNKGRWMHQLRDFFTKTEQNIAPVALRGQAITQLSLVSHSGFLRSAFAGQMPGVATRGDAQIRAMQSGATRPRIFGNSEWMRVPFTYTGPGTWTLGVAVVTGGPTDAPFAHQGEGPYCASDAFTTQQTFYDRMLATAQAIPANAIVRKIETGIKIKVKKAWKHAIITFFHQDPANRALKPGFSWAHDFGSKIQQIHADLTNCADPVLTPAQGKVPARITIRCDPAVYVFAVTGTAAQQNGPIQQMFRVFKALGAPRVV